MQITCEACSKLWPMDFIERDHKVPPRIGGTDHHTNIQMLCLGCHKRKSALEASLFSFDATTEVVREWYGLAFQYDREEIKQFVDKLTLRVAHFREVAAST